MIEMLIFKNNIKNKKMINTNLNIPLDKLYKIMALGGSAFFILAIYFTYTYVDDFENKKN